MQITADKTLHFEAFYVAVSQVWLRLKEIRAKKNKLNKVKPRTWFVLIIEQREFAVHCTALQDL